MSNETENEEPIDETSVAEEEKALAEPLKLPWYMFDGNMMAAGFNAVSIARGTVIMSNIFLSASFLYLASEEAGCLDDDDKVIDDCTGRVYGFKPASLVANIAVIAGVLSALFLPIIGAIIDYTPHRKAVGMASSLGIMAIQAVQIGTVSGTWFPMSILQALAAFLFEIQVVSGFSYLPGIARVVGEEIMTKHSSTFVMVQFIAQILFLIVVTAFSLALSFGNVETAQFGQALSTVTGLVFFWVGWTKFFPPAPASHTLPAGHSLLTEGFVQLYRTAKMIHRDYSHGLRWFLLAIVFAEAASMGFVVVAVIYLDEHLGMSGPEIGIFFVATLVGAIPGTQLAKYVNNRLDPNRSWQLSMVCIVIWVTSGAIIADSVPIYITYPWGLLQGVLLGWFYPTENLFFSMCMPKGQEAELSGIFVYCTQILAWLPPLIFSLLVQADVNQTYAVFAVVGFFVVAIVILRFAAPWDKILEEAQQSPREEHVSENA